MIFSLFLSLLLAHFSFHADIAKAEITSCVNNDYKLAHRFTPNCSGIDIQTDGRKIHFTHNKLGLRDMDYSSQPAKHSLRILLIGPSMLLNFSQTSGVVPAINKKLKILLKKNKYLHRKFKNIEMISGAEAGYHTIQSYLRLEELLFSYHPHIVLFFDSFQGFLTQEIFDHTFSAEKTSDGLAKYLGIPNQFWPLPKSWNEKIWQYSWASRAMVLSTALRMNLFKIKLSWFPEHYCDGDFDTCLTDLHFRYIDAMRELSQKYQAHFAVLWHPLKKFNHSKSEKISAWYKPEWVANKFFHLKIPEKNFSTFNEGMKNSDELSTINVEEELTEAMKQSQKKNPTEYHLDEASANLFGEKVAQKIFNFLLKLQKR